MLPSFQESIPTPLSFFLPLDWRAISANHHYWDIEGTEPMRGPTSKLVRLTLGILLLCGCVGCDQTTKYVATHALCGATPISCLSNTFRLEYALNPGGFLSLGSNIAPELRFWLFAAFNTVLLLAVACVLTVKWNMRLVRFVALVSVLGGGIGNLIDRLLNHGLVIDFLNLGIGPFRTGVFNVADVALTAGSLALVLSCRGECLTPTSSRNGDAACFGRENGSRNGKG